ncbi:Deubiquitinating protein [Bulinus truncatus]|nr:Deubiquitinating protein [Bulinus truncatus]
MKSNLNILCGVCPNCQKKLFFPEHEASVECTGCGQRQTQAMLKNLQATGLLEAIETLLNRIKQSEASQKEIPNPDNNNVNGLSNYLCAMLSPLLTSYGMDKVTGRAKLLTEMGKSSIFDCGQLADRAFLIDPEHLNVPGYGRDRSGSNEYLRDTLDFIKKCNENDERLVPIHADGDGHCLVHAVSRSLVGWQLFWHPLRMNLLHHFEENFSKYQMQFQDFIDDREWQLIIRECDPDFIPTGAEPTGLRNIHIFGLANVLKRPIILLDSLEGIQSPGDYSVCTRRSISVGQMRDISYCVDMAQMHGSKDDSALPDRFFCSAPASRCNSWKNKRGGSTRRDKKKEHFIMARSNSASLPDCSDSNSRIKDSLSKQKCHLCMVRSFKTTSKGIIDSGSFSKSLRSNSLLSSGV